MESLSRERIEIQHTAYRQLRLVFGIAPMPNTDFESITPNKFSNCSHWVESVWKHNTQPHSISPN